jgi:tetratricopeptide (TPR) repeat protein
VFVFDVPDAFRRLADQVDGWLDLRCPDKALALLEPMLANANGRPAALGFRIRALVRLGQYTDALIDLGELRQNVPQHEWIDLTEAWCRKRTGDLRGAIRAIEQLLARDHRHASGRFNLACYLALAGDTERAIDELTLACGIDEACRDFARDDPDLDGLRTDPRFRLLLRQVGTGANAGDLHPDDPADDLGEDDDPPPDGGARHRRN